MVEFHVDSHRSFQGTMYFSEFGGNASLKKTKNDKIIISFGNDGAIFNKYTYTSACWSGCYGGKKFIPNSEGMGLMVSAIQYREFGFGIQHVTDDKLRAINN